MSLAHHAPRFDESQHPVYMKAFDERTREALMGDDSVAWRTVCAVLISIVTLGMLGILFVVLTL